MIADGIGAFLGKREEFGFGGQELARNRIALFHDQIGDGL